jgi:hypothetical protein
MNRDSPDIQARLAALADGTLAPDEREQLLAQIDSSSELGEDAEAQRHAVSVMSSLESVHAPAELHRSVQVLVAGASHSRRRRPRRRLALRLLAPGALAAAAVAALLIALTSGGSGAPTLLKAADVALAPATLPAPAQSVSRQSELTRSVEGIAYPYWQDSFGWRATGARVDRLAGRMVTTVFYAPQESAHTGAGRIGYAIVAGVPLPLPHGGTEITDRGIAFHLLSTRGATVLTWRRAGHTCVLAARGVSSATLVHLAAWE